MENSVSVILPAVSGNEAGEENTILRLLRNGNALTRRQIEEGTGLSRDQILRLLRQLKDRGVIRTVGKVRGTKYIAK